MSALSQSTTPPEGEILHGAEPAPGEMLIRAINNDNLQDAKNLAELFESHYGASHPFPKVYQTDYWCNSRQSKLEPGGLISLVAEVDGRFVAHIGLDHLISTGGVQLLLPAIHPDYRTQLFKIVRRFWKRIVLQAERQDWSMIFTYNLSVQPLLQVLAAKCYHSEVTAILPGKKVSYGFDIPQLGNTDSSTAIVVMCNSFKRDSGKEIALYPPDAHFTKIKDLYDGIDLERKFITSSAAASGCRLDEQVEVVNVARRATAKSWSKKRKRLAARSLKRFGLYQLRVIPSALTNFDSTLSLISQIQKQRSDVNEKLTVQVALNDPRCPEFCKELESQGYRFCGVLPLFAFHDFIAYSKFTDEEIKRITLYSEKAKSLREYMLQHTLAN